MTSYTRPAPPVESEPGGDTRRLRVVAGVFDIQRAAVRRPGHRLSVSGSISRSRMPLISDTVRVASIVGLPGSEMLTVTNPVSVAT